MCFLATWKIIDDHPSSIRKIIGAFHADKIVRGESLNLPSTIPGVRERVFCGNKISHCEGTSLTDWQNNLLQRWD
ncbi:hypothetical protein MLD38_017796 [Melastoma candidum]|uniref:Uncharacterized protein n=1 Tax=Melastoma candidum TaxID=119954 RepID=A0ACB9QVV9_9MYRT|nr:hypothetical protein MLD38_017796 [Melastoma candidum]